MYQFGDLLDLRTDDPQVPSQEEAERQALHLSNLHLDRAYGVWSGQKEGSELLGIAHTGEYFRRA